MPTAQCECGALSATVAMISPAIVACHCTACQRRSGSPFGLAVYYPDRAVTLTGEPRVWSRPTSTGGEFVQRFCGTCGSTLWFTTAKHPGLIGIAVGAFADSAFPAPLRSVWEESRHAWVVLPDGALHFEQGRTPPPGAVR